MDKQREEFYKAYPRHEGILELYDAGSLQYLDAFGAVRDFMVLQAAQAAMQPEIVQLAKDNLSLMAQHADATKRIAELEERIRVADAEEPVGYVQKGIYVNSAGRLAISDEQLPVYLHAQIPAEVELKKLAEMYLARRKHAYKTRIQAQMGIGNMRQTEEEFNAEYDAAL